MMQRLRRRQRRRGPGEKEQLMGYAHTQQLQNILKVTLDGVSCGEKFCLDPSRARNPKTRPRNDIKEVLLIDGSEWGHKEGPTCSIAMGCMTSIYGPRHCVHKATLMEGEREGGMQKLQHEKSALYCHSTNHVPRMKFLDSGGKKSGE